MPRTTSTSSTALPPTPAPSNDILAKSATSSAFSDSSAFVLPPAALGRSDGESSSVASSAASDSSYRPISPTSPNHSSKPAPVASKKRPASGVVTKDDYTLPPPPTRSRKIIQMKPQTEGGKGTGGGGGSGVGNGTGAGNTVTTAAGNGKKKAANGATAAGRKIARKTAHSLIERRRRSKMNEEFGVLKDMIPACAGQEMHKLAILQASIDYMRYLEQCVSDLKATHRSRPSPQPTPPLRLRPEDDMDEGEASEEDEADDRDQDEDMSDSVSPHTQHPPHHSHHQHRHYAPLPPSTNTSPALYPADSTHAHTSPALHATASSARHYSLTASPALQPSDPHHYSLTSSLRSTATSPNIQPSPAFSAQGHMTPRGSFPSLTSPALGPVADREDHEATEALLMLNTDRRSWTGKGGMSVKDLLSG